MIFAAVVPQEMLPVPSRMVGDGRQVEDLLAAAVGAEGALHLVQLIALAQNRVQAVSHIRALGAVGTADGDRGAPRCEQNRAEAAAACGAAVARLHPQLGHQRRRVAERRTSSRHLRQAIDDLRHRALQENPTKQSDCQSHRHGRTPHLHLHRQSSIQCCTGLQLNYNTLSSELAPEFCCLEGGVIWKREDHGQGEYIRLVSNFANWCECGGGQAEGEGLR